MCYRYGKQKVQEKRIQRAEPTELVVHIVAVHFACGLNCETQVCTVV